MGKVEMSEDEIKIFEEKMQSEELLKGIAYDPKQGIYMNIGVIATLLTGISENLEIIAKSLQQNKKCDTQGEFL